MASTLLSQRQLDELQESIVQYIRPLLKKSDSALQSVECALKPANRVEIPQDYLIKKWSTVLRLQKSILDLENRCKSLQEQNQNLTLMLTSDGIDPENAKHNIIPQSKLNWLPTKIKATLRYHTSSVTAIAIHPFNPILATGSQSGDIAIWDLVNLTEPKLVIPNAHTRAITDLKFQPTLKDPLLGSCSYDQLIKLWDITGAFRNQLSGSSIIPTKIFAGHSHIVSSLYFSPSDPNLLISASRDSNIFIWDINLGWSVDKIQAHSDWVRNLSITSNGEWLLSCSSDTSIRLTHLKTSTGIGLCIGNDQVIEDIAFLPIKSNKYLDKLIDHSKLINNTKSFTETYTYESIGFKYAISVDRSKLLKIWLLPLPLPPLVANSPPRPNLNPNGQCLLQFKAHKSWIRSVDVHPSGRWIVTSSDDGTSKIWDLAILAKAGKNKDINAVVISNGEKILPIKTLDHHDNFVNVAKFAQPIMTNITTQKISIEQENDKGNNDLIEHDNKKGNVKDVDEEDQQSLELRSRCYLITASADETVHVYI